MHFGNFNTQPSDLHHAVVVATLINQEGSDMTVTMMSTTSHRRCRRLPAARAVADNAMIVLLFATLLFASISTTVTDGGWGVQAFAPSPQLSKLSVSSASSSSTTRLHIIGPMIRKMRENADKRNMPMANPDEVRLEAPGKSSSARLTFSLLLRLIDSYLYTHIRLTHTRTTTLSII